MSKYNRISNTVSQSEFWLGLFYLLFELFVLPTLLSLANAALHYPLGSAWINFIYFCINFIAVLVIFRGYLGRAVTALGKNFMRCIKGAFLGFCVYYVSNLALSNLINFLFPWFSNVNDANVTSMLYLDYLPMLIGTVFLVPMVEEVLYRGLVFGSLYVKNHWLGYVLSTAIFCAIHILGYIGNTDGLTLALCFIQYIPAGLCLAWAYTEGDSIFSPILIHMVVNAMGVYAVR